MNFAREGLALILGATLIAIGAYAVALNRRSWPLWLLAFALTLVALWVAYFFRDPERTGLRGDELVISPADGRVMMVTEVDEPTYVGGPAIRVSIFLNIFNVHVNRYPVSGTIERVHYTPGRFLNAAAARASLENEQMSVGINTGEHRVLVRQIAGLIARRLVTYSKEGERIEQGERMGLMKFGSRMDVFIPPGSRVHVKVGDNVVAGETIVAELPGS
ncbi:MAG TPA: phosphatidylserine decarboxylase family protein [Gemmatimonadales bacterium]